MSKFKHHKYTYTVPYNAPRHMWQLVGPKGGVHFTANISKEYGDTCGLEFHGRAPFYCEEVAPTDVSCWLIGGPCWHDGTSLYASETLWPMIKVWLHNGDHEMNFRCLEGEYERKFEDRGAVQ